MSKPYVIEPPEPKAPDASPAGGEPTPSTVHRPRIGAAIMDKLDAILEAVHGDDDGSGPIADGTPQVTFEPEPDQLPTTPGDEDPDDEGGDDDKPDDTANTPVIQEHQPFKFPGRRYARELER